MIYLYSGTPGSGKSYHATIDILRKLKRKSLGKIKMNRVISNYSLDVKSDDFHYLDNSELNIEFLKKFALQNHVAGVEGQTLVVIDEAQIHFNSRNWNSNSNVRMDWLTFFSQHRKYGYNFILIAQYDLMIDKQIRCLIEYQVAHMMINNYFRILPIKFFLAVTRWYGQRMKLAHEIIMYRKKVSAVYNSFATFN